MSRSSQMTTTIIMAWPVHCIGAVACSRQYICTLAFGQVHSFRPYILMATIRPLGYESVYLPLCEVTDTPFHIQGDELF